MFTIKSYGFGELSALFSPDINMASASKQLKRWIVNNPKLLSLLLQEGWEKGCKRLVIWDINPKNLETTKNELNAPNISCYTVDVSNESNWRNHAR